MSCTLLNSTRALRLAKTSTTSLSRAGSSPATSELYSWTKRTLLCGSAIIRVCEKLADRGVFSQTWAKIGSSISIPCGTYKKKPPVQKAACSAVYLLVAAGTHSVIKYFCIHSGYSCTAVSRSVRITPCCLRSSRNSQRTTLELSWTSRPERSLTSADSNDCSILLGRPVLDCL